MIAMANPDDFGYPWLDTSRDQLVVTPVTQRGRAVLAKHQLPARTAALTLVVSASSQTTISKLDAISDDITRLASLGIPNADLIWMTEPDEQHNRVVITLSKPDPSLQDTLVSRYGVDLIEARVQDPPSASAMTRDSDAPYFFGGAYISTSTGKGCTTGFAWAVGSQSAMLTAAHCISTGGTISYPSYPKVGTVKSGYEENWNDSTGTTYYTGQSTYRGDVALARYSSLGTTGVIYSGAPHTSTHVTVSGKASRYSSDGDAVCVNGVTTGEWCGMVRGVFINRLYNADGPNVWARHMIEALSLGNTCPTHGDSGGPAYRRLSSTSVAAVGILSGSAPLVIGCDAFFTDIWDAYYALPGDIK